ncbi:MAG: methyltransferase regulatory domain-containing protein [Dechloromonas sp.]|uniref:Methyltransferase regulatory domain-containing protein n=1 Tax=Candidatus Dechloromonas phosphorivorans TaxID=2899244 RepID=A0A935K6B2_9RHOO|nr:methyltransferase regulatory domain-containing protein [Candidatus Dechloromonas phosphorivorans]
MLDKVAQAIGFLGEMNGKGMRYFKSVPGMDGRIERLGAANTSYVAHEYLNQEWHPQYFHEVVAEMSAARLEYVCAGQLSDNIDAAILPSDALKHLNSVHDQVMRETLRDYYLNTQFRRDLYTRGATRLSGEAQTEILMTQRWLLITAVAGIQYKVATSGGDVTLEESAHRPIIEALHRSGIDAGTAGPARVANAGEEPLTAGFDSFASVGYVRPCAGIRSLLLPWAAPSVTTLLSRRGAMPA